MNNTIWHSNKTYFSLNIWKLSKMQIMQTLLTSGNKHRYKTCRHCYKQLQNIKYRSR